MGGPGSGSYGPGRLKAKPLADDHPTLDIFELRRSGGLSPGSSINITWELRDREVFATSIHVLSEQEIVLQADAAADNPRAIHLTWTDCAFGGRRPWLVCPKCDRRVAKLYLLGGNFLCRHCHSLNYAVQREAQPEKAIRKARKILHRITGSSNLATPFEKPPGMTWARFIRAQAEIFRLTSEAVGQPV